MATGDNGLTAISVGRHCGIIDSKKTVYLAELLRGDHGHNQLKWVRIEPQNVIEDYVKVTHSKSPFVRDSVIEKKNNVRSLAMVAGYEGSV
mmetsp:Transcript_27276/g.31444  ORF Transcript_27276/g.31444 Transcript_27276/m.31444 type:complete len:91 (+) Transcript_27276:52-324(+)